MLEDNNLLAQLEREDRAWLASRMETVEFDSGHVLFDPGDTVSHCYFPIGHAVASFLVMLEEGAAIETVMVGREGALGGIVNHGDAPAFARSCVMHGGRFHRIAGRDLEEAKQRSSRLRELLGLYADCLLAQIFQAAACNATHTLDQRAAKWLVGATERTGSNEVIMTQEQLASMLGVGRSYVSRILNAYKARGLVQTSRGRIAVLHPEMLRQRSCPCDGMVRGHFDAVLKGVYPSPVAA